MFDTATSPVSFLKTSGIVMPGTEHPWQQLSHAGLEQLLKEHANNFAATMHIMPFAREVFLVDKDFQEGDVFQRALIIDTLLDFNPILKNQLKGIIDSEIDYLLASRRKTGAGGWAYFPDLRELPPDADDLAQVMQVLIRAGYPENPAPFFEEPLHILLNDQPNEEAWETWIVPKTDLNEEQQLQTVWINKAWGTGTDTEVVANLMIALMLYDKNRFAAAISRGIDFLANQHNNHYYWRSTWYYGNYYGTFLSIRALCEGNGPKQVIEGAITFIENTRQSDGGWAVEEQPSSPLQTALALLALSTAKTHLGIKLDEQWLALTLHYLQQAHLPESGWQASPFIRMPMGRPTGFVHTILTYQSETITNNYIAKACNHIYQNHIKK